MSDNEAKWKPAILVLDDEEHVRKILQKYFEKDGRYEVHTVSDGFEGLEALKQREYSLVITDLRMPNLGGLEFIRRFRPEYPDLPFIVFTGFGEIEDAIEALRLGAINFLRKPWDLDQVIPAVEKALHLVEKTKKRQQVYQFIDSLSIRLTIPPRMEDKDAVIEHLVEPLVPMGLASETELRNVFLALDEVILNAIQYGALGLDSSLRDEDDGHHRFQKMLQERSENPDYVDRFTIIRADYDRHRVVFRIRDPGEGFDYNRLPDPTDPANLMKEHGRGLLLVQCFMDEVSFNDSGNEIRLVKKSPE